MAKETTATTCATSRARGIKFHARDADVAGLDRADDARSENTAPLDGATPNALSDARRQTGDDSRRRA